MDATYPYPDPDENDSVDAQGMARLLDCTVSEVHAKSQSNIILRVGRGRYHIWEGTRNYVRWLRERVAHREGREVIVEAARATSKFKTAQERLTSLKADQLAGRLVDIDETEAAWVEVMTAIRQSVVSIPGRFRFQTPHMTTHDQKVLETICRDVLEELASGKAPTPKGDR